MGRWWGIKISFGATPERNEPTVYAPVPLVLMEVFYVIWFVFVLGFALVGAGEEIETKKAIMWAIAGGLLPVVTTYTIATNRRISRFLVPASVLLIEYLLFMQFFRYASDETQVFVFIAFAVLIAGIVRYLLWNKRAVAYYRQLAGESVPGDFSSDHNARAHAAFEKISRWFRFLSEWSLVLLALALLALPFWERIEDFFESL